MKGEWKMRKTEVQKVLQERIDRINNQLPIKPTKEQLEEAVMRADEVRNIAMLLNVEVD